MVLGHLAASASPSQFWGLEGFELSTAWDVNSVPFPQGVPFLSQAVKQYKNREGNRKQA